jgi:thiol:disulfide interchange protein
MTDNPRPTANPLKPVWGLFAILVLFTGVMMLSKAMRPKEVVPWRTDYAAAAEEARRTGKPMMAYFTANWCGPCQSLKHTTWADKAVEAALRDYVPVKIDVDRNGELAARHRVGSIPAFVVLDAAGERLNSMEAGALPPEAFIPWLRSRGVDRAAPAVLVPQ